MLAVTQIEQVCLATLDDADWARCYALNCAAHAEHGSRTRSLEAFRNGQLGLAPGEQPPTATWFARAGSEVIGRVNLRLSTTASEFATVAIYVHPEARRGGVGLALARAAAQQAVREGTRRLEASAWGPAAWQFCERRAGRHVGGGLWQTLRLESVNWTMIDQWCARAPAGARLVPIEQLPDELAEAFLALYASTWADQPSSERGAKPLTLARRRDMERRYQALGFCWLTLLAQEPSGALVGLTEVIYDPSQPETVRQVLTGVLSSYRGRGLAKWLKASMLRAIRRRYPKVSEIVTSNSELNASMLAINRGFGFGQPIAHRVYSFELDHARV